MSHLRNALVRLSTVVVLVTSGAAFAAGCGASGGSGRESTDDPVTTTGDSGGGGADRGGSTGGGGSDATVPNTGATPPSGDSGAGAAEAGPACTQNSDCASKVCAPTGTCAAPSCTDGAQNGTETDLDCGGSCAPCDVLKRCALGADCISGVCSAKGGDAGTGAALLCQAPTNTDGVKNGDETGVDCGGAGNPVCPDGQGCAAAADCSSDVCTSSVCAASVCNDGVKNGTETDVDCGGGNGCGRCVDGDTCNLATDCLSGVCAASKTLAPLTCQTATYTDGVQNGAETDVDCGGDLTHPCPVNDKCLLATDCQSEGCDYTHHCALRRSCTGNSSGGRWGADTCGRGGEGGVGTAQWESCCATVDISVKEGTMTTPQVMHLDKYKTTAGRMRAFLESVNYDVRDFVEQERAAGKIPVLPVQNNNPAGLTLLDPAWDKYLSTSYDGDTSEPLDCDQSGWNESSETCTGTGNTAPYSPVYTAGKNHVGPTVWKANSQSEQGCEYGLPGTHTYYEGTPDYEGQSGDFTQPDYDVKPLQCVDYFTAQAFCLWDGGRLETYEEWLAAWGPGAMPWTADKTDTSSTGAAYSTLKPHSDYVANYPNAQMCSQDPTSNVYFADVCNGGSTYTAAGVRVLHPSVCNSSSLCTPAPTYTDCRFPQANDTTVADPARGCLPYTIPPAGQTIELADWESSYEYPALVNLDFSVFMAAPGRTLGRAPNDVTTGKEGAADILGDTFELTSDISGVSTNINPFPTPTQKTVPSVRWSGNGSWEVHGYTKDGYGPYRLMDKYGKLGLRCIHPT